MCPQTRQLCFKSYLKQFKCDIKMKTFKIDLCSYFYKYPGYLICF